MPPAKEQYSGGFVKRDHCTALWAVQHTSMPPTSFLVGWGEKDQEIESGDFVDGCGSYSRTADQSILTYCEIDHCTAFGPCSIRHMIPASSIIGVIAVVVDAGIRQQLAPKLIHKCLDQKLSFYTHTELVGCSDGWRG